MSPTQSTIFLTAEETERIRNTFRSRLQRCKDLAGQSRFSGDSKASMRQVAAVSFIADITTAQRQDSIVAFAVGCPYPPCTLLLCDLQPIQLCDLRMDTHHRSRVLSVRRVAPVVKLVAFSWTVVQDSSGETERFEISLHKLRYGYDILESGSVFEIKEPYFTLSDEGHSTLRVDHPSDIIQSSSASEIPQEIEASSTKTTQMYKDEGNAALKNRDLPRAHANYTQGLHLVTTNGSAQEDFAYDLFRNRAHVNLALHRFDEAKTDALASLTGREDKKALDSKAYFRAGCAAHGMGEFHEARRYLQEQQRLAPYDKLAAASVKEMESRLREQATGAYNFKKIKAGLLNGRPRVDAAKFTSNVAIGESCGGRGLFAKRRMDPGEIIMVEKAFCAVWGNEAEALTAMTYDVRDDRIRVSPAGLCRAIVEKLQNNPSLVEKVMDLYSDYPGLGKQLIIRDAGPVIDTFQIHDIVARNAFATGPAYSGDHRGGDAENNNMHESTGLWITASYLNHSCVPNAKREILGDLMVLRATQPVNASEEITHSYDGSSDIEERSAALLKTWGFACSCALCIVEKAETPALRKKRQQLENEASAFVERNDVIGAKRVSIVKARRLARAIDDTYNEGYKDLPRSARQGIQDWLAEATSR
ncbi:SET and MYND domain-containing protein [Lachnellula subtilissima]|uniref:SET and MYND domain-containing protein n=1 Tax=Lachnellula subtilissima TaxID=602034 RepID=A0A8H8U301_9HELO|nr:SET and MYND domain-containing protein [Lachnellula subtilissima]